MVMRRAGWSVAGAGGVLALMLAGAAAASCGSGGRARPDGPPSDAPIPLVCGDANPFGTCPAAMHCSWIVDVDAVDTSSCSSQLAGHVGCAPDGTQQVAEPCTFAACGDGSSPAAGSCDDGTAAIGADDCGVDAAGHPLVCVAGRCEQSCTLTRVGPTCDAAHSCGTHLGVFENFGSAALAGVCDPRCDPVSQRTRSGSAEACGSLDPAIAGSGASETYPELGCYENDTADPTFRLVDFACAPTTFGLPVAAYGLGSGSSCSTVTDPPEDRIVCDSFNDCGFFNTDMIDVEATTGCAPGYVNLTVATSGFAFSICSAYCAPLDTDDTQPGNAIGDALALGKDVTDPAAVAGRATCDVGSQGGKAREAGENCVYAWPFASDPNTLILPAGGSNADIDAVGICLLDSAYEYDPTDGDGILRVFPSCATLRPGLSGDPSSCGATGEACAADAICLAGGCHIDDVECGSGSGHDADGDDAQGNEADCFAWFHACYNSVEEGAAAPQAVGADSRRLRFSPAVTRLRGAIRRAGGDRAPMRRAGGIH